MLCDVHFKKPDDYENWGMIEEGLATKAKLKKDAVPSKHSDGVSAQGSRSPSTSSLRKSPLLRRSKAVSKLLVNHVSTFIFCTDLI